MKKIIITGCSSGFGFIAAQKFAERGDQVVATMRNPEGNNQASAEALQKLGISVLEMDVISDDSVQTAATTAESILGAPDVVINNAGQMYVGLTEAFSAEELKQQLDVNVVGIHRLSRCLLPGMRAKGSGLLINLSSIAGRFGAPFFGVYNASKWAVEGYSQALRRELACTGVDVVVVEPGPFTTNLFSKSPHPADKEGITASYPAVAMQTFESMGKNFEAMFESPDVPTDPIDVVMKFIELVDMKPGTRPFRSVVGLDVGVIDRNRSDEAHEAPFLQMMGLEEFASLKT
jgi:NAD(P)-dependent dehydrogenase (short-subunit alcohol dehydrogenase family)